jgi:hypothetical protein
MSSNPEDYRMTLDAVLVPREDQSREVRTKMAKKQLADCLALSVLKMDRFLDVGVNAYGDEVHTLELFLFTRGELNEFMEGIADATAQYLTGGSKQN